MRAEVGILEFCNKKQDYLTTRGLLVFKMDFECCPKLPIESLSASDGREKI